MGLQDANILVIDDDLQILTFLENALSSLGAAVVSSQNAEEGIARYATEEFDLVLLDFSMPQMNGLEVLNRIRALDEKATVIIMTGYGSIESAVNAMKTGALDYLTKPLDMDHLQLVLSRAFKDRCQAEKLRVLEEQVLRRGSFEGLVGISAEMQKLYGLIDRIARSDATMLIQGETGTGKELVARAIHRRSRRKEKPFVAVNCGALSESLLESELFGHEKGAFTGAVRQKKGLIEQASGGTLFLDEVEAMSPALQIKLLRALQEGDVRPVGGEAAIRIDFRLVAASNADLRALMEKGQIRPDLFYRLSVVHIDLPPLRRRREDIPLLATHFLSLYQKRYDKEANEISEEAMMVLKAHDWPGNVRELENAIQQALVLCDRQKITVDDLPASVSMMSKPHFDWHDLPFSEARKWFEKKYLEEKLAQTGGRVTEAAQQAGLYRQRFYEKVKQHGIALE